MPDLANPPATASRARDGAKRYVTTPIYYVNGSPHGGGATTTRYNPNMSVTTYEAVVHEGQIRLPAGVLLDDETTVYVVVPSLSPRLTVAERHAEIAEAYADYPDAEEEVVMRGMRRKMARVVGGR